MVCHARCVRGVGNLPTSKVTVAAVERGVIKYSSLRSDRLLGSGMKAE